MDNTDRKILKCLRENSRENASVIGEKINMSVSAVIERIKKLENTGVIKQYTVVLDNKLIGKDVAAYISVAIEHPKFYDGFTAYVASCGEIISCNYVAGDYDFFLTVNTDSTASLEKLINDIKRVGGVSRTKTLIVLSTLKNHYSPSVD